MRRQFILVALLSMIVVLSGCGKLMPHNTGDGAMTIRIVIPGNEGMSTASLDGIVFNKVAVTLTKGSDVLGPKEATIVDNVAEVAFADIPTGEWQVSAVVKDQGGISVYEGTATGTVTAGTVADVTLDMKLLKGSVKVTAEKPAGASSAQVVLTPLSGGGSETQAMEIDGAVFTYTFEQKAPIIYSLKVTLYVGPNCTGEKYAEGETNVDILPGRQISATVKADTLGSLSIDTTWEVPPGRPTGLSATLDDTAVTLTWQAPDGGGSIEGYAVYRAEADGNKVRVNPTALAVGTTFTDHIPQRETHYQYWVAAVSSSGLTSAFSAPFDIPYWRVLGGSLGGSNSDYVSAALSSNGTPYVAFRSGNQVYVKQYTSGSWLQVGGTIGGYVDGAPALVLHNDVPYVAFYDDGWPAKIKVYKFQSGSWQEVASVDGNTDYISMAADSSGVLYIAYQDGADGNKAKVKRWSGASLEDVDDSIPGVAAGMAVSVAISSDDVPYVAFIDADAGGKAVVKQFDGDAWQAAGDPVSSGGVNFVALQMDGNQPYVVFRDSSSYTVSLKTLAGSSWQMLGSTDIDVYGWAIALAVDNGTPYVAFRDGSKATVMKHDGSLRPVGRRGFSGDNASNLALAVRDGVAYLGYRESSGSVSVMKYGLF